MPAAKTSRAHVLGFVALAALAFGFVACARTLEGLGEFPCADDFTCPEGWTCVGTKCINTASPSADGGLPVRDCEYHDDCKPSGKEGVCVAVFGGASTCAVKCTGFASGCPGEDCKLVLSGIVGDRNLVQACTPVGTGKENAPCKSVDSCTYGLTCAADKYDSTSYLCTEICHPFKTTCTNENKHCTYGMSGYPADWGLCYLR